LDQLDQLIEEIALVLGIEREEVFNKFTKEDLDKLLAESKCDPSDNTLPLFSGDALGDDIPCEDLGAPLNPDDSTDIDSLLNDLDDKNKSPDLDVTKCVDSVNDLNKEIEEELKILTQYRILLDKLVELRDNLVGIQYYYEERITRAGIVLNDFKSVLENIKNLKDSISGSIAEAGNIQSRITQIGEYDNSEDYASELSTLKTRLEEIYSANSDVFQKIQEQELILQNKSSKYPTLNSNEFRNATSSIGSLNNAVFGIINEVDIFNINRELNGYSEFVNAKRYSSSRSSYSEILSNSLIQFEVEFQNFISIETTKEEVVRETGETREYDETILIRDNPLLEDRSFFSSVPGYIIKNVREKEEPSGALYSDYYNKLSDPINNFFTIEERGLTSSANLVDPNLKGTDNVTKKENGTEYYIADLKRLENFYENFDSLFKERRKQVKDKVIKDNTEKLRGTMAKLARLDVDALLSIGRVNLYLPEEDSTLSTIVDSIKNANSGFAEIIGSLNSEITRIEEEIERLTPSVSDVKGRLKAINPECFDKIDDSDEEDGDDCKSVKSFLGSDPFFESISKGSNGALPNCTQLCYWREFAKVVNKMGLFPIPNDPRTLRYWPVGLVLYVPAEIKIPLPIIWIPVLTITSPVGTHVLFITINGLFITPVMFFFSSSGLKQHIATIKGSTDKFGFDRFDETIKDTIKIPLSIGGLTDPELKQTAEVLDKEEGLTDIINDAVKSISKRMDDLGNPVLKGVNKVKEKIQSRQDELRKKYNKSVEDGNTTETEDLKRQLSTDGINIDEKIDALTEDIIGYFDRIDLPTIVLPKEKGKVNPNISGNKSTGTAATESSTNKRDEMFPESKTSVLDNISTSIAKYKDEIESTFTRGAISIDEKLDDVKDAMSKMVDKVFDKATGKDAKTVNPDSAVKQLNTAKNEGKDKLNNTIKNLSDRLDNNLVKQTLSITPNIISALSNISVEFDPFASCCSIKKEFSLPVPSNPLVLAAFNAAKPLVVNKIKSMSAPELKSLLGGRPQVNARDLRLGLLSIVRVSIPKSISFPKPDLNVASFASAFGGILGSLEIPQASFPPAPKALTMPKQVNVNLNIVKAPLKNLLQSSIRLTLPTAFPQDLETYFYTISPKDVKRFLKDFIRDKIDTIESQIKPFYTLVDISKSSKGTDLSVVEKGLFNVPPYGPALSALFSAKTLAKMNLPNSNTYFSINLQALELAVSLLKPALTPIVSTPIVYPVIAGAAVAGGIDGIRKLHPILNQDDIPSWERLTAKNILLLVFIDEFIVNAADNLGFYRSYL